jgi:hypothetical protein
MRGPGVCRLGMPAAGPAFCRCSRTAVRGPILYALDEVEDLRVGDLALTLGATESGGA